MKKLLFLFVCVAALSFTTNAQTAEEIIDTYLETIGGKEKLSSLKSLKLIATGKAQGMELPITMHNGLDGKTKMDMVFQGKEITQMCFDGETGWSTNFMTMEAEKWDSEESMVMKSQNDNFPDAFLDYKEKGYTVTLDGEEEIEGTPCFKILLTKKPVMIDGKEQEIVSEYYFDKDSFVPIMQKEYNLIGEMKGTSTETYFSDYDEVEGLYFAFTLSQKMNGQTVFDVTVNEVVLNPELDDEFFGFPKQEPTKAPGKE